jgi:hypothetical protein
MKTICITHLLSVTKILKINRWLYNYNLTFSESFIIRLLDNQYVFDVTLPEGVMTLILLTFNFTILSPK